MTHSRLVLSLDWARSLIRPNRTHTKYYINDLDGTLYAYSEVRKLTDRQRTDATANEYEYYIRIPLVGEAVTSSYIRGESDARGQSEYGGKSGEGEG